MRMPERIYEKNESLKKRVMMRIFCFINDVKIQRDVMKTKLKTAFCFVIVRNSYYITL